MKKRASIFLFLYLLLQTNFLYLLKTTPVYELLSVVLIFVLIAVNFKKIIKEKYLFNKFVLGFTILVVFDLIYSFITYRQGIVYCLYAGEFNFLILGYYIFSNYIKNGTKKEELERVFIIFSFILSSLFIMQYLLYSKDIIFLKIQFNERFGTVRINQTTIIPNLGFLLAAVNLIKKENSFFYKIFCFIVSIIDLVYIVMVSKVRVALLIVAVCILLIFIIKCRKNLFFLIYFAMVGALGIFCVVYYLRPPIITTYLESIDEKDSSFVIREDEIEYFLGQAKKDPIFGAGIIYPLEGTESYYILMGADGLFYASDVGLIGLLQSHGFTGVIWYVMLLLRIIILSIKIIMNKDVDDYVEVFIFLIYMICTSGTLIITDKHRNFMLPIILAIIEESSLKGIKE